MNIEFNRKEQTYTVDGAIADVSVTQLLRKHGLAPNYNGINEKVLNAKAEMGTYIHADLEHLINDENYSVETPEGEAFKKYVDKFVDCAAAEQMLAYKFRSMTIAGTADVVGYFKDKEKGCFIADHKTTANINKEYVSWQTSILDYMLRHTKEINGRKFNWKGANELLCFHYKDGDLEVIKLDRIPDEEIERLFGCEYEGVTYTRKLLVLDPEVEMGIEMITNTLSELNARVKQAEAQQKKYKEIILKAMEEQGIKSYKNDVVSITYVGRTQSTGVDTDKLKKCYPKVWEDCMKISNKAAYLKITIKGEENE